MTDLEKAARIAVGAWLDPQGMPELCKAMEALTAALEQPAQQEPLDLRVLIRKIDAEAEAAGLDTYTAVHNGRMRLLTTVRHFLAVANGYLPDWLLQPAQAMRDATEQATCKQPLQVEQPAQQEPVAEVRLIRTGGNAGLATHIVQIVEGYFPAGTKLYTSPPAQRQPLTDEEIAEIAATPAAIPGSYVHSFARAIEAAHGIGEKK